MGLALGFTPFVVAGDMGDLLKPSLDPILALRSAGTERVELYAGKEGKIISRSEVGVINPMLPAEGDDNICGYGLGGSSILDGFLKVRGVGDCGRFLFADADEASERRFACGGGRASREESSCLRFPAFRRSLGSLRRRRRMPCSAKRREREVDSERPGKFRPWTVKGAVMAFARQ